ncbi:MAG: VWA domain-containing protein, partial [Candidatus Auribacterota bacterium]|nr:VWA domain-containing protein [Candidatus Auribacterota bacterium]
LFPNPHSPIMSFQFNNPNLLFLLFLIPLYLFFYWRNQKGTAVRFSSIRGLKKIGPSPGVIFRHSLAVLRSLSILLLVLALARPQKGIRETRITTEGIDIMLTVDVSTSMLAEDFTLGGKRRNRLEVARQVIADFIRERSGDRIGMVVFAGQAYTQCPLTIDYSVLLELLDKVEIEMIKDGTAIGTAISTSLNRLRESEAKSKIIILLTDGDNNAGKIDPQTAARMAEALDIKIYTIGIGSKGPVPYPVRNPWTGNTEYRRVEIPLNETSLKAIAAATGGEFYLASNTGMLEKVFSRIDELEKTTGEEVIYTEYNELFPYFIGLGFLLLLVGVFLANTRYRRLP